MASEGGVSIVIVALVASAAGAASAAGDAPPIASATTRSRPGMRHAREARLMPPPNVLIRFRPGCPRRVPGPLPQGSGAQARFAVEYRSGSAACQGARGPICYACQAGSLQSQALYSLNEVTGQVLHPGATKLRRIDRTARNWAG